MSAAVAVLEVLRDITGIEHLARTVACSPVCTAICPVKTLKPRLPDRRKVARWLIHRQ